MTYLKCENVKLGYSNMVVAENINFSVEKGDYLCILGQNGAGKSTLIKTILGLIEPLEGKIIKSEELDNKNVGYLPQKTVVQKDFPASVMEIVLSGTLSERKHSFFYNKTQKELAKANMEKMNIWQIRNKCFRKLSGGQQQRVLLARAICSTDKVLLLDEPVSGLDPIVTADFYSIIKELNSQGTAIIMVSHDVDMAVKYANKILYLDKENEFFGTKEEFLETNTWKNYRNRGGNNE